MSGPTHAQDAAHAERSRRYHVACAEAARREVASATRAKDTQSADAFREVVRIQMEAAAVCAAARDGKQ